jgi:hypothetical protein
MKRSSIAVLLACAALLAALLVSCQLLPVSIEQRIQNFQDALNNSDRTNAYKNLHPDSPAYTVVGETTTLWNTEFLTADIPYTIGNLPANPAADPSNVTATITGTAYNYPAIFVMQLYMESDWRIWDIQLDKGGGYATIF